MKLVSAKFWSCVVKLIQENSTKLLSIRRTVADFVRNVVRNCSKFESQNLWIRRSWKSLLIQSPLKSCQNSGKIRVKIVMLILDCCQNWRNFKTVVFSCRFATSKVKETFTKLRRKYFMRLIFITISALDSKLSLTKVKSQHWLRSQLHFSLTSYTAD